MVAADPVLLQPISNGHAARMRYSRFRATVSENRPSSKSKSGDKTRVSKSKSKSGDIKCAADGSHIKQEYTGQSSMSHYSPASTTSPYLSDNRDDFSARFLTPCSDDMASVLAVNPAAVEGPHNAYSPSLDFMNAPAGMHSPHNDFSAFDEATFDMGAFTHETQAGTLEDWNDRLHHHF